MTLQDLSKFKERGQRRAATSLLSNKKQDLGLMDYSFMPQTHCHLWTVHLGGGSSSGPSVACALLKVLNS